MKALRVAILTGEFPVLSETFVMRQISGLLENGVKVTVLAGKCGDRSVVHGEFDRHKMSDLTVPIRTSNTKFKSLFAVAMMIGQALFSNIARRCLIASVEALRERNFASIIDIAERFYLPKNQRSLGNFDAIIAHFGQNGVRAMYLRQAGLLSGPIATIFHGFDMSNHDFLAKWTPSYRKLFERTERLLPISHLWRRRLIEWGAEEKKITILRMGVDVNKLKMVDLNRAVRKPLKVLSVARLTEKKGIVYAIDGVKKSDAPIHYRIIGSGPLESELRSRSMLEEGSAHKIEFLGRKTHQEVFSELDDADVFLLPSITAEDGDMEGVPVSIMEAMAKGVIVLATRHSGIPELVEDGVSGFLVSEKNSDEIAQKLNEIFELRGRMPGVRWSARKKIEDEFDNSKLDLSLVEIVRSLEVCARCY